MKKRTRTLIFVSLLAFSCSPSHEEFVVAGANQAPTSTSGICDYTPQITGLLAYGFMPIGWQAAAFSGEGQELHYYMALTLVNTLGAGGTELQTSSGQDLDTSHQYDVQVTSVDITFTTIGQGAPSSIPEVVVPATGYVPEAGEGIAIFDIMSADSSKSLANAHTNFTLLATVTVSGTTAASSPQVSDPFQFPIQINTDPVPTCTEANTVLSFSGGPCGAIQDSVAPVCVDAGLP